MAKDTITLVQLARLGDLAQTWLLISRLQRSGRRVRLLVEEHLSSLAELMVGAQNTVGVNTFQLRRLAGEKAFYQAISQTLDRLSETTVEYVINLNFHPATAALAEAVPASKHGGALWRDVAKGIPSDEVFRELFLHSFGKGRLTGRHLSEIWGGYCEPINGRADFNLSFVSLPDSAKKSAEELLFSRADICPPYHSVNRPVAIIVGAGLDVRAYGVDLWLKLIDALTVEAPIILVGSKKDYPLGEEIVVGSRRLANKVFNLCGATDPGGLAGLLSYCRLVIGTDTGPLHVAAMVGTKCLGLYYGSMYYRQTGPYCLGSFVIAPDQGDYPCSEEEMDRGGALHFIPAPPQFVAEVASAILSGGRFGELNGWQVLKSSPGRKGLNWKRLL